MRFKLLAKMNFLSPRIDRALTFLVLSLSLPHSLRTDHKQGKVTYFLQSLIQNLKEQVSFHKTRHVAFYTQKNNVLETSITACSFQGQTILHLSYLL